jgi:hypothetical protein
MEILRAQIEEAINQPGFQLWRMKAGGRLHSDSRVVAPSLLFNNFIAIRVKLSKYGPNQMFSVHIRHHHLRSIGVLRFSGNQCSHSEWRETLGFDHSHPPEKFPALHTIDTTPERISGIALGNGEVKDRCIAAAKDMRTTRCRAGYAKDERVDCDDLVWSCEEKADAKLQNFDNFHII